jgi:monothiol glutaredoxin
MPADAPCSLRTDVDVTGVDILSNPLLRSEMKTYSNWPTFPQLYVDGEFVGGCDITTQMHQSGELAKLLGSGGAAKADAPPA